MFWQRVEPSAEYTAALYGEEVRDSDKSLHFYRMDGTPMDVRGIKKGSEQVAGVFGQASHAQAVVHGELHTAGHLRTS